MYIMFVGIAKQLYWWCIVSQSVIWYCMYLRIFLTTGKV